MDTIQCYCVAKALVSMSLVIDCLKPGRLNPDIIVCVLKAEKRA